MLRVGWRKPAIDYQLSPGDCIDMMSGSLFVEILLAIVAEGKRVQRKSLAFRGQRKQMRCQHRILDHVVHPRLADLDVGAATVRLYVSSCSIAEGVPS